MVNCMDMFLNYVAYTRVLTASRPYFYIQSDFSEEFHILQTKNH